jgi:hypothetical protein
MYLPISYFEYKNFTFDQKSFIQYWTKIEDLLYDTYNCDEIYEFKIVFESIKNKKFFEFTTIEEEASLLRNKIHDILIEEYEQTPLQIFKEFYQTIKNDLYQGMYGHSVSISMPKNKVILENEIFEYATFYNSACFLKCDTWPHHYLLKKEAFYKVENIPIRVYFALVSMDCYILIDKECKEVYWGN